MSLSIHLLFLGGGSHSAGEALIEFTPLFGFILCLEVRELRTRFMLKMLDLFTYQIFFSEFFLFFFTHKYERISDC